MTSAFTKVAVVTPVHNRKDLTLLCLKSLSRVDVTGLDVGVWIVDDGSTDGTADAIRESFPDVNVIKGSGDLWFTEGTNVGISEALKWNPDYLLMINDDQIFDERSLFSLVDTAKKCPRSVVGPILLLWDEPHRLFQTAPVWKTFKGGWQHWFHQTVWTIPKTPWRVDLIVGNCLLVPAAAIRECGLMDSKHFPNFGDAEYTPRLKRHGWELLVDPRSRVFCQPNYIPPRVREKGLKKLFYDLVIDLKNGHSLRRRFHASVKGGPSKIQGLVAFLSFLALAVVGKSPESSRVAENRAEPPLSEVFAGAIVND